MSKAVIAMSLMAASTAVSAYGAYAQGKAQKKMYEYNAAVQQGNASAEMEALEWKKYVHRQNLRKIQGTQRVLFTKAGVSLQFTPHDLDEDTMILAAQDEATMEYNAAMKARGYKTEAEVSLLKGRAANLRGKMQAFGTILGGASQTMQTGYAMGYT